MGKKVFSLCMALVLCLGLLPATALAAAPDYQVIYVGSVKISSTGYWTTDSDGNVTAYTSGDTPTDNYIHYDVANNTLTLHNATIKESVSMDTSTLIAGAAIGVHNQRGAAELTITLEGTNTIAEVGKGIYVLANSTGGATLTITGDGSLDASASQTGIWVQSNNGNATLTIRNAKVEATGTSTVGYGVNVQSSNSSTAALTVDGGSLTASGSPGILYDSIGSGTVPNTTALTISNSAIVDAREGGIGAGLLQDLKEVSPADDSVGIVFGLDLSDSKAGAVYGSVELHENLTIGEGESLKLDSGASLNTGEYTLKVDGGTLTGDVTGTVNYKVTGVSLNKTSTELTVGQSETLTATITPDNATNKNVTWSSDNQNVATVDANGNVTAVGAGTAQITVTTADGSFTDTCQVTINAATVSVTGVTLDKAELHLDVGDSETLTAAITPDNATDKAVRWTSSNPSVATVNNGEVTAVSAGEATITVTTADGGFTAECTVTVRGDVPDRPVNIPDTHEIELISGEGGEAKTNFSNAGAGAEITVTATPDAGYELAYITVNGERISGVSFTMPAHDVTVRVYFSGGALPFADVDKGAWYYDAVSYVYANGLMDGTGASKFAPEANMTRAMVWTILARIDGEEIFGTSWAEDARAWAMESGVSDGTDPSCLVTREQFAAMLHRYAGEPAVSGSLSAYTDAASVSEWATDAMLWATQNGIITGTTAATLAPQGTATRAQAAAMLMRFAER